MTNDSAGATQLPLGSDATHTCVWLEYVTTRTNAAGKAVTEKRCVVCGQRPPQLPS